jgi:two-component sensor histidine kinase
MVPYLTRLGDALAASMIGDVRPVTLKVVGTAGSLSSREAESIGLITTELVMNALKHAFPSEKMNGRITVAYDADGTNWKLSVADNGIGKPDGVFAQRPVSERASSRRSPITSTPRLKPWPVRRAQSSRSPMPLSRQR